MSIPPVHFREKLAPYPISVFTTRALVVVLFSDEVNLYRRFYLQPDVIQSLGKQSKATIKRNKNRRKMQ